MPKLSIDDVKRMMTNAHVKAMRYNEAAHYLRNDRTPENGPTAAYIALKFEARRLEGIANGLNLVLSKANQLANIDKVTADSMAKIIAQTKK